MSETNEFLFARLQQILFRCWLSGLGFLLLMFAAHQLMSAAIYKLHMSMFGLTVHELDVVFYCAMGLLKLSVLVLFFIPWLAIKSTSR